VQSDARRLQSDRLRLMQMQAQLGVPPAAPAPHPDDAEGQCVLCFDAPKDHIILPCYHVCVCEAVRTGSCAGSSDCRSGLRYNYVRSTENKRRGRVAVDSGGARGGVACGESFVLVAT
jgi:hypothetical protein